MSERLSYEELTMLCRARGNKIAVLNAELFHKESMITSLATTIYELRGAVGADVAAIIDLTDQLVRNAEDRAVEEQLDSPPAAGEADESESEA